MWRAYQSPSGMHIDILAWPKGCTYTFLFLSHMDVKNPQVCDLHMT